MTDNKGRTVDFKNTIIIMTSNIGSHIIQENLEKINEDNREEIINQTRQQVFDLLKKTIKPEFLNRIDEIIMFQFVDTGRSAQNSRTSTKKHPEDA